MNELRTEQTKYQKRDKARHKLPASVVYSLFPMAMASPLLRAPITEILNWNIN